MVDRKVNADTHLIIVDRQPQPHVYLIAIHELCAVSTRETALRSAR